MTERTRLRISVAGREFEVEGSEEFVREFVPRIESLLEYLGDLAAAPPEPVQPTPPATAGSNGGGNGVSYESSGAASGGSFGEFMLRLPSSATDVDRMLAAGFFVQQGAADDAFGTADANKKLTEQGIKLGNPSQCVKQSLIAKRVFMVQRGRYRVSQHGRAHLRQLLGGGAVAE